MKSFLWTVLVVAATLLSACNDDISFEERDALLTKAFQEIESNNEGDIKSGLSDIKRFPTADGLKKLLSLWEKDISRELEEDVLDTLYAFEVFRYDNQLMQEIYDHKASSEMSRDERQKLMRLLAKSDSDTAGKLLEEMKKAKVPQ